MRVYYDRDADLNLITDKKIAIVGYGSQGHAHAQNLRDSGVKEIAIALRPGSATAKKAEGAGFKVMTNAEAAAWADITMILAPTSIRPRSMPTTCMRNLKQGSAIAFAHGLNVHFALIEPRAGPRRDHDRAQGPRPHRAQRICPRRRRALPDRDRPGRERQRARHRAGLCLAASAAAGRASSRPTSARNARPTCSASRPCSCGGLTHLIQAGFETLAEAGYAPEMAYFECLHEVKLIVDLMYEGGIANMRYSISNTAEYGDITTGPRIITDETKAEMKRVLADIQGGRFVKNFVLDNRAGQPELKASRKAAAAHPIEKAGARAARDDALDRREQAGGQGKELSFPALDER